MDFWFFACSSSRFMIVREKNCGSVLSPTNPCEQWTFGYNKATNFYFKAFLQFQKLFLHTLFNNSEPLWNASRMIHTLPSPSSIVIALDIIAKTPIWVIGYVSIIKKKIMDLATRPLSRPLRPDGLRRQPLYPVLPILKPIIKFFFDFSMMFILYQISYFKSKIKIHKKKKMDDFFSLIENTERLFRWSRQSKSSSAGLFGSWFLWHLRARQQIHRDAIQL